MGGFFVARKEARMPYCFSCGRLRKTYGGFCAECKADEYTKGEPDRKIRRLRENRKRDAAADGAAFFMPGGDGCGEGKP